MFSQEIINKLQHARRNAFTDYDSITLDSPALKVFARLFVNPDCQTDIDLFSLEKPQVKLSYLGDHIITAAPSTIAQFAQKRKLTHITDEELLSCFALDHAHDVHENKVAEQKSAFYALAHILHASRISKLKNIDGAQTAELELKTGWGSIVFKHVVVPYDMNVTVGENVFHHFGVIVAHAKNKKFAQTIAKHQKQDSFIQQLGRDAAKKKVVIDFANESIFKKDVLGQMMKPHKTKEIKNPGDIKNNKVMFKN